MNKKLHGLIIEDILHQDLTAGSKALKDVRSILNNYNTFFCYHSVKIHPILNYTLCSIRFLFFLPKIYRYDKIIIQYPFYTNKIFNFFCFLLFPKHSTILIHDLNTIRYQETKKNISKEIKCLNHFNYVISHTPAMETWLKEQGLTCSIITLGMFDYLTNNCRQTPDSDKLFPLTITFAGNLCKSKFVDSLIDLATPTLSFSIWGIQPSLKLLNSTFYKGTFDADYPESVLYGTFGLVWDGDSLDYCSGNYGEYLRYNSPHKFSLYISVGLPVIVWEKSALANLVKQENIGIVISSLYDINNLKNTITQKSYAQMQEHVKKKQLQTHSGLHLIAALEQIKKV